MLLPKLRAQVLEANLELVRRGLVLYTFGNVSGISREQGLVVIKPSGVTYEDMKPEHLVVSDLAGKIVEGTLRPSSDLPTHLVLYKAFSGAGGVAHSDNRFAPVGHTANQPSRSRRITARSGLAARIRATRGLRRLTAGSMSWSRVLPGCTVGNGARGHRFPSPDPGFAAKGADQ